MSILVGILFRFLDLGIELKCSFELEFIMKIIFLITV